MKTAARITAPTRAEEGRSVVLHAIDWRTYEKFLDAVGNRSIRLNYNCGTLEIMAPSWDHEWWKNRVSTLLLALSVELQLDFQPGGSTTFRREDLDRGVEADDSFYLANAKAIAGLRDFDLTRDPPPDLALEVDITSSSIDRMSIYAALGVPEVWRVVSGELHFFRLQKGDYEETVESFNLPFLTVPDVHELLTSSSGLIASAFFGVATHWARDKMRPLFDAWTKKKATKPAKREGRRRNPRGGAEEK